MSLRHRLCKSLFDGAIRVLECVMFSSSKKVKIANKMGLNRPNKADYVHSCCFSARSFMLMLKHIQKMMSNATKTHHIIQLVIISAELKQPELPIMYCSEPQESNESRRGAGESNVYHR
jgi:hypothetical protein